MKQSLNRVPQSCLLYFFLLAIPLMGFSQEYSQTLYLLPELGVKINPENGLRQELFRNGDQIKVEIKLDSHKVYFELITSNKYNLKGAYKIVDSQESIVVELDIGSPELDTNHVRHRHYILQKDGAFFYSKKKRSVIVVVWKDGQIIEMVRRRRRK